MSQRGVSFDRMGGRGGPRSTDDMSEVGSVKEGRSGGVNNSNVQVVVRVRPMSQMELAANCDNCIMIAPPNVISVDLTAGQDEGPSRRGRGGPLKMTTLPPTFQATRVVGPECTQVDMYNIAGKPAVQAAVDGYNACIFAFGQTGSGKTYTMGGLESTLEDREKRGLTPQIIEGLFSLIKREQSSGCLFTVTASYLEIYKNTIYDLLNKEENRARSLSIHEDPQRGVFVANAIHEELTNNGDVAKLLRLGASMRSVAKTDMNYESSRSHAIFTVYVKRQELASGTVLSSRLNLVDLAGSERQKISLKRDDMPPPRSGSGGSLDPGASGFAAGGDRLKEASTINTALSALGNVINALAENREHVPYRDSKLTRLLQNSLGGNAKTLMVATVSPATNFYTETLGTLRFAERVGHIKNKPVINQEEMQLVQKQQVADLMEELKKMAEQQAKNAAVPRFLEGRVAELELELNVRTQLLHSKTSETDRLDHKLAEVEEESAERVAQLEAQLQAARDELDEEVGRRKRAEDDAAGRPADASPTGSSKSPGESRMPGDKSILPWRKFEAALELQAHNYSLLSEGHALELQALMDENESLRRQLSEGAGAGAGAGAGGQGNGNGRNAEYEKLLARAKAAEREKNEARRAAEADRKRAEGDRKRLERLQQDVEDSKSSSASAAAAAAAAAARAGKDADAIRRLEADLRVAKSEAREKQKAIEQELAAREAAVARAASAEVGWTRAEASIAAKDRTIAAERSKVTELEKLLAAARGSSAGAGADEVGRSKGLPSPGRGPRGARAAPRPPGAANGPPMSTPPSAASPSPTANVGSHPIAVTPSVTPSPSTETLSRVMSPNGGPTSPGEVSSVLRPSNGASAAAAGQEKEETTGHAGLDYLKQRVEILRAKVAVSTAGSGKPEAGAGRIGGGGGGGGGARGLAAARSPPPAPPPAANGRAAPAAAAAAAVPSLINVECGARRGTLFVPEHVVVCMCNDCNAGVNSGRGVPMAPGDFAKHAGTSSEKWEEGVIVAGTGLPVGRWLERAGMETSGMCAFCLKRRAALGCSNPDFSIPACGECYGLLEVGSWRDKGLWEDDEGFDAHCRVCAGSAPGGNGENVSCDAGCRSSFCTSCIWRFFPSEDIGGLMAADDWSCFLCRTNCPRRTSAPRPRTGKS